MTRSSCESCGMPIESGHYCVHCTDETGALGSLDSHLTQMVAWQTRRVREFSPADECRIA